MFSHLRVTPIEATPQASRDEVAGRFIQNVPSLATSFPEEVFRIEILECITDVLDLEEEWKLLDEQQAGAAFFQSWYWSREYIRHCMEQSGVEPFVLTARNEFNELVALLPLAKMRKKLRTCLTGLTEPYQQYTDMLLIEGYDAKQIFEEWLPYIKNSGVDYIHLGQVREDSVLVEAIDGLIEQSGEQDAAPFVDLSGFEDFDDYYKSVKTKTRKNMRNARNRLGKLGHLSHLAHESGKYLSKVIANVYEERSAWLERMGLPSRAFNDEEFLEFINRFKSAEQNGFTPVGTSLKLGEHPIAEQLGFIHQGCYYAYISGWDNVYSQFSPGKLHLGEIIKVCCEKGLHRVDFMIPAVPYKFTWATGSVNVTDYVLPLSNKGHFYNSMWLNFLRPKVKEFAYKLPAGVRSKLFAVYSKLTG